MSQQPAGRDRCETDTGWAPGGADVQMLCEL